jgi:ABC-type polysaccharide/polyol phosphate export permease
MNALAYDWSTLRVLWRRDVMRFWRQPSRVIGALGQPVIFWLVLGTGMAATFAVPGLDIGYLEFFFPGVVMMVLLFASIFASVSVLEDRAGFLRQVRAGPASPLAMVLGKCLGSSTIALMQAGLFLALLPLAGFSFAVVDWPLLLAALVSAALGLTALGFALAWWLGNMQAYHAVQMSVLTPLWVISGAVFPPSAEHPVFGTIMGLNPAAYAVSAVRHAIYGGLAPAEISLTGQPWAEVAVVAVLAGICQIVAAVVCHRRV